MKMLKKTETNVAFLILFILIAVSVGGAIEILPLVFNAEKVQPIEGLKPYTALQLEGRDVFMREGCAVCHTQMVRALRAETERYGHYSVMGEDVYEHPFLWGSKRTGPDLARVGGRYSDDWHRAHLMDPRSVVPQSNMPRFPWLFENVLDGKHTARKLEVMRILGVPYTDADIASAAEDVQGFTESEAVIAYLQSLGLDMANADRSNGS